MTHNEALAYCAGVFDGEGTISIRKLIDHRLTAKGTPAHRVRYHLVLEVNQVRPEAIHILHTTLGGRVKFVPRSYRKNLTTGKEYSGRWLWDIDSRKAADVLRYLLPYLTIKWDEANVAIAFQDTKLDRGSGRSFKLGRTTDEIARQEEFYQELKRLKRLHNDPAIQAHYTTTS